LHTSPHQYDGIPVIYNLSDVVNCLFHVFATARLEAVAVLSVPG